MYIKISLKHPYDSYTEIPLISTEVKKGAFIYNTMTDAANKILALLDSMVASEPVAIPSASAADELLKYKQLLDLKSRPRLPPGTAHAIPINKGL